ncbi:MAG: tryptophan halogenase family protein [Pseudomonadota bacterium]
MTNQAIRHVVIVGGGTAGWITAGLLAARHPNRSETGLKITLVESPDVPTIGVGEGTWPTIRKTLARMGIAEDTFLRACNASFKQGSRFDGWVTGAANDSYYHPFELPVSQNGTDVLHAWKTFAPHKPFAEAVCAQVSPGLRGLAPRKRGMPDYFGALNYAYHLDAPRLAEVIRDHAVNVLGVHHIRDHVTGVVGSANGLIQAVTCKESGAIHGDLFVDCTGQASLLLGQHYGVPFVDQSHILFNDRAVVTQVPVSPDSPIVSETVSTAHDAGWIWDIGLTTRRGVGCVYSSAYMDDDRAEKILRRYIATSDHGAVRRLSFTSGHRAHFWHQNCLAIGLSAGFLEPLEASAIVLLELSAEMLAENLPASQAAMPLEARRFNRLFLYRWGRIIEFLKFHYVLSKRGGTYWEDNRRADSIPERLQEYLETWSHRPPGPHDFEHASEVFPVSSYLYVAYGMGMKSTLHPTLQPRVQDALQKEMLNVERKQRAFASGLPTNRALLAGLTSEPAL